jgi:hypothetical protein
VDVEAGTMINPFVSVTKEDEDKHLYGDTMPRRLVVTNMHLSQARHTNWSFIEIIKDFSNRGTHIVEKQCFDVIIGCWFTFILEDGHGLSPFLRKYIQRGHVLAQLDEYT